MSEVLAYSRLDMTNSGHRLFDKVLVIDQGRQVFFGPAKEAHQYFIDLGFQDFPRQTTADYLTGCSTYTFSNQFSLTKRLKLQPIPMSENISQAAQPRTSHPHLLHSHKHLIIQGTMPAFKSTAKNTTSSWKPKSTTKTHSEKPWRRTRTDAFLGTALIPSHSGSKLPFSLVENSDSRLRTLSVSLRVMVLAL